ncbi:MAG: hypothetical protein Q9220_001489 [cf. Caloplaca sp. 1 TL-2023]
MPDSQSSPNMFINIHGPNEAIDEDTRQSVRSFVMRKYIAEQKRRQNQNSRRQRPVRIEMASTPEPSSSDTSDKAELESSTESTCDEQPIGYSSQSSLTIRNREFQRQPKRRSAAAERNSHVHSRPQGNIVEPLTPTLFSGALEGDQEVLHFCSTVVAESMIPLDTEIDPMNDIWLPAMASIPLLRHTLLFRESGSLHGTKSGKEHPLTITHRMMTIRLLNERLAAGAKGCDELAMASIGALAGAAINAGDIATMRSHLDGLAQVLATQGGMDSPRFTSHSKEIDFCGAVLTDTKPRYTARPINPAIKSLPGFFSPSSVLFPMGRGFRQCLEPRSAFEDTFCIVHELRGLTTVLEVCHGNGVSVHRSYYFQEVVSSTEARIYAMAQPTSGSAAPIRDEWVAEACRLTGLIYLNVILRNLPPSSAVCTTLASRIKAALSNAHLQDSWGSQASLLLWILTFTGPAFTSTESRRWVVEHLIRITSPLKLYNWAAVKNVLYKFLTIDLERCEPIKSFWSDILSSSEYYLGQIAYGGRNNFGGTTK